MVYRFKIVSDEAAHFRLEIEIDSEANFLQLRNAILDAVGYTKDDMSSFFICDDDWTRREEITLEDMGFDNSDEKWLMADTRISELVEDEGQKLMFVFDYLTERAFFMEMKELITGRSMCEPLCTKKEGKAPAQRMTIDEMDAKIDQAVKKQAEDDFDLDLYGSDAYDQEDLPEGIEEL